VPSDERLFDPKSRAAIRAETDRSYAIAFGVTAVVLAGLGGGLHYEELPFLAYLLGYCSPPEARYECSYPVWVDGLAAVITLVAVSAGLAVVLRHRRIQPTVTCRGCESRGWIIDLAAKGGRCPRCGHDRFRYRGLDPGGVPVVRILDFDDVEGDDLLELRKTEKML
jgi:hypothetical protein